MTDRAVPTRPPDGSFPSHSISDGGRRFGAAPHDYGWSWLEDARSQPLTVVKAEGAIVRDVDGGLQVVGAAREARLSFGPLGMPIAEHGPARFWLRVDAGAACLETATVSFDGGPYRRLLSVAPGLLVADVLDRSGLGEVAVRFDASGCVLRLAAAGLAIGQDGSERLGGAAVEGASLLGGRGVRTLGASHDLAFTHGRPELEFGPHGDRRVGELLRLTIVMRRIEGAAGFARAYSLDADGGPLGAVLATRWTDDRIDLMLPEPGRIARVRLEPAEQTGRVRIESVRFRAATLEDAADRFQPAPRARERLTALREAADVPVLARAIAERLAATDRSWGAQSLAAVEQDLADRNWEALSGRERDARAHRAATLAARPLISVLTPVYDPDPAHLRAAIESVRAQTYDRWELCLADDASTDPAVRRVLEEAAAADPRIKVVLRTANGHISAASNAALELATGEWIALLDHDDLLTPDALHAVAEAAARDPDAQLIYSDEDKLGDDGRLRDAYHKPDWSPSLFEAQNYLNHLTAHRTENVRAVGGWRLGFEGSQDYDLSLRIVERIASETIVHVPRVLYHWRAVAGSTAVAVGEKDYAWRAGLAALEGHVERTGIRGHVEKTPGLPFYRLVRELPRRRPLVSLLMPTRDKADVLALAARTILDKTEYDRFELLILDNGSVEPATFALFDALRADPRVRIVPWPEPFNYSAVNNFGAREARGEILGLINNDVEVIDSDWLTEMVRWAARPEIGCVGAKLYYPDDTIQHAGVVLGIGGVAGHGFKRLPRHQPGAFALASLPREVSAVTGACLLVRREVFLAVGGLDERNLAIAFNDVDLCIRVRDAGWRNIFTPYAQLYHHESLSRGAENTPEKQARFSAEVDHMLRRWGPALARDPYYSPHMTLHAEDYGVRRP